MQKPRLRAWRKGQCLTTALLATSRDVTTHKKVNLISEYWIILFYLCLTFNALGQEKYPLWQGIESGNYNVGFKIVKLIDSSRTTAPKHDESNNIQPSRFFPIQISIWYPTEEKWDRKGSLKFKDYFYATAQKNTFKNLSKEQQEEAMDIFFSFAKYGLDREFSLEEQEDIGNTETAAIPNAKPMSQKFPVLMAGHDGGVWKMSTLSEYLASHGYVVISTGLLSKTSRMFSEDPQITINRRIRTFEIIRGMLNQFEFIDENQIGLLGLNADGISTLLYQMKNREAGAIANIDGWDGKNNGSDYIKHSIYFNPTNINVPFLEIHQHEVTVNESLQLNTSLFDSLTGVDRFSFVLKEFGHAYLTGNLIAIPDLPNMALEQHQFWYTSIKAFFDSYLKQDDNTNKYLWNLIESESLLLKNERIRAEDK